MKYFIDKVYQKPWDRGGKEDFEMAYKNYKVEYLEARKRLPKKFINIYETNSGFHDASVPSINILTDYLRFSKKDEPTRVKFIIEDADDEKKRWELVIEKIKNIKFYSYNDFNGSIEVFIRDEILIYDKDYLSWEIIFSGGFNINIVFKNISIKQLPEDLNVC